MSNPINKLQESNRTQEAPKGPSSRTVDFSKILQSVASEKKVVSREDRIRNSVENAAQKYNLPPALIYAVIQQESGFNPAAESHCGAQGLMQLMPETAKQMGVDDSLNIEQNIDGGSRYLREMLDRFDGNVKLALAAYNAGPGRVEECRGIPQIAETQNYVPAVLSHYAQFNGSSPIDPDRLITTMAEMAFRTEAIASAAITSSLPLTLKLPERRREEEPPPPPPPQGVRV